MVIIAWMSVLFVSSSCSEEQTNKTSAERVPIVLTASLPATRAANDIQEAVFDKDETVNAFIRVHDGDWIGNPTVYTTSAPSGGLNKLVPDVQPFFPSSDAVVDVFALYPKTVGADDTEFSVASDQHTDAAYKASDLMYASSWGETVNSGVVNLQFTHKMAKLIVTATGDGGVEIAGIRLHQMYPTLGYSHSGGVYTSSGAKGTLTDIELANGGSVLIPPQEHVGFLLEVTTTDSKRAIYSLTNPKMFKAGKVYRLNVTVGPLNLGTGTAGDPEGVIDEWPDDVGTVTVAPMGSEGLVIDSVVPVIYKNAPWEPTPRVRFGADTELTSPTDFTYQYFDNTNVGTAAVLVVGAGKYTGLVAIRSFEIQRAEGKLQYANKSLSPYFAYNNEVPNTLTITGDGDMHYTSSNTDVATVDAAGIVRMQGVGHARITASMDAKNYTAATDTFHIEVKKKTISDDGGSGSGGGTSENTVKVEFKDNISSYVYTGQAIQPEMVVKDGNITLTKGTHYTVTYENNINCSQYKDDGPTAIIHGVGGYDGTMSVRFAITQATPVLSFVDGNSGNFDLSPGSEITRTAQSSISGTTPSYVSSATSVATVNSTGLIHAVADGETTITISLAADNSAYKNWKAATSLTFKVYVITNIPDAEYTYKNSVQSWTCNMTGYYTVEVAGAGGGGYSGSNYPKGGEGGFIRATIQVTKGTVWSIVTGGGGTGNNGSSAVGVGGYNGGGSGGKGSPNNGYNCGCGGGGATHIATGVGASSSYLLTAYSSATNKEKLLIVAGGGGGASYNNDGGSGGGEVNGSGADGAQGQTINGCNGRWDNNFLTTDTTKYVFGGNQTGVSPSGVSKSYLFGQGGTGIQGKDPQDPTHPDPNSSERRGTGGGGGGLYGGFAYQREVSYFNAGGGGGSGYIKSNTFILVDSSDKAENGVGGGGAAGSGGSGSSVATRTGGNGYVKIIWRGTQQPTTAIP